MANKMIACKACNKEIAASAKTCPHCGSKNKKPIFTKWWFWLIIAFFLIGAIGSSNSSNDNTNIQSNIDNIERTENQNTNVSPNEKVTVFSGDCGISATAEMGTDIIGQPTITVSIINTTDKDISAIKFYAIPLDVYGEELNGIFAQNELYTDDTIAAGASETCSWQFLDEQVKTVKLYVYSVYFSDSTEWGDKTATKSTILDNGLQIEVQGTSEK